MFKCHAQDLYSIEPTQSRTNCVSARLSGHEFLLRTLTTGAKNFQEFLQTGRQELKGALSWLVIGVGEVALSLVPTCQIPRDRLYTGRRMRHGAKIISCPLLGIRVCRNQSSRSLVRRELRVFSIVNEITFEKHSRANSG